MKKLLSVLLVLSCVFIASLSEARTLGTYMRTLYPVSQGYLVKRLYPERDIFIVTSSLSYGYMAVYTDTNLMAFRRGWNPTGSFSIQHRMAIEPQSYFYSATVNQNINLFVNWFSQNGGTPWIWAPCSRSIPQPCINSWQASGAY
jgi:hypothetical protein